jgi:hypothetical protein
MLKRSGGEPQKVFSRKEKKIRMVKLLTNCTYLITPKNIW